MSQADNTTLAVIAEVRRSGDWNRLAQFVPYLKFIGMRLELCLEQRGQTLRGVMPFAEHLIGNPSIPALHGGTIGSLLEAAAQFETIYRSVSLALPKTITLTIDYLRPGRPLETYVKADLVKQGRRVCTARAVAWQECEDRPIAGATVHLLVLS